MLPQYVLSGRRRHQPCARFSYHGRIGTYLVLIFWLAAPALAISAPPRETVVTLDPVTASFGKASQIDITLPQWQKGAKLNLQPGGPVVTDRLSLSSPATQLVQFNGFSYAVSNHNELIAIDWRNAKKIVGRYRAAGNIRHVKTSATHIVIAVDGHGIIWLDVSSPTNIHPVGLYQTKGRLKALAVTRSGAAYTKQHKTIQLLQVTQSNNGVVKVSRQQSIHVSQHINDLWLTTDKLYVTGAQTGLTLYDISQPKKTTLLSGFKTTGQALSLLVSGRLVFVADGTGGLAILDVTNPHAIRWRGSHSKLGAVTQVVLSGTAAIVNNANQRLASLNIDRPELPITASLYKPGHTLHAMAAADSAIYLATGNEIQKLQFNREAPVQISHAGINQGGSRRAYIENGIAYVADWFSGLHIYDLRLPQQPRHLGNFHTPGSSKGVVVRDGIAYIGDDDHGLQIVDVSNPRQPKKISELLTTGLAYTLKLVGNRVYLADHRGGFDIIDVSNKNKPRMIGSFNTPGKSWAIAVKGHLVYVADDQSGLLIFDIRDPAKPVQVGQFDPGGYAEDVAIEDNIAYVSFFDKGLYLLDISKPGSITEISHIAIPGNARSIALRNGYAYIAGWESGLQIIDVSRKKFLRHVGYLDTDGSTWGADIAGDYAYLWDWWGGIKVADISNPRSPVLVGRYQGRGRIQQLQKRGNYAFAAHGSNGLQVFDITNPLNPIWVTGVDMPGFAGAITIAGDNAYLAMGDAGIAKLAIGDPFYPRWLGALRTSGYSAQIQHYRDYLYVSQTSSGIDIISARADKQELSPVGRLAINARDIIVAADKLIVAHAQGIDSYGLDEPGHPLLLQHLPLTGVEHLTAQDDILVASLDNSVRLYKIGAAGLRMLDNVTHDGHIDTILAKDQQLYIYSNHSGVAVRDLKTPHGPSNIAPTDSTGITNHYPATGAYHSMLEHKNVLLFSGQSSIASLTLLPTIKWRQVDGKRLQLSVPEKFPLGSYHIELELADGQKFKYPDLIQVKLGKSKKPRMTMEQFKKLLQKHTQKKQ